MDTAKVLIVVGLLVMCSGFILHFVGFSTPHWITVPIKGYQPSFTMGLFKVCYMNVCNTNTRMFPWFVAVQALTIVASILFCVAIISSGITFLILCYSYKISKKLNMFVTMCGIVAGILDLAAIGVFCENMKESSFGFSLYLCATGALLIILGSAPVGLGLMLRHRTQPPLADMPSMAPSQDLSIFHLNMGACQPPPYQCQPANPSQYNQAPFYPNGSCAYFSDLPPQYNELYHLDSNQQRREAESAKDMVSSPQPPSYEDVTKHYVSMQH